LIHAINSFHGRLAAMSFAVLAEPAGIRADDKTAASAGSSDTLPTCGGEFDDRWNHFTTNGAQNQMATTASTPNTAAFTGLRRMSRLSRLVKFPRFTFIPPGSQG
jgi:hypothetical protein